MVLADSFKPTNRPDPSGSTASLVGSHHQVSSSRISAQVEVKCNVGHGARAPVPGPLACGRVLTRQGVFAALRAHCWEQKGVPGISSSSSSQRLETDCRMRRAQPGPAQYARQGVVS